MSNETIGYAAVASSSITPDATSFDHSNYASAASAYYTEPASDYYTEPASSSAAMRGVNLVYELNRSDMNASDSFQADLAAIGEYYRTRNLEREELRERARIIVETILAVIKDELIDVVEHTMAPDINKPITQEKIEALRRELDNLMMNPHTYVYPNTWFGTRPSVINEAITYSNADSGTYSAMAVS